MMDPTRFDALARGVSQPLARRRLLFVVAGFLTEFVLGTRGTAAQTGICPNAGNQPCGGTTGLACCGVNCCIENVGYCADAAAGLCCQTGQGVCQGPSGPVCALCGSGAFPDENCECRRCNAGTERCGNTCCEVGETCQDDTCVASCETPRQRTTEGQAIAACPPCPQPGMDVCLGQCFAPCPSPQVRDFNTCACLCLDPCGDKCCPLGQVCAFAGGNGAPPKCCSADDVCAGVCKSDPDTLCCGSGAGATACLASRDFCCSGAGGTTCCRKGKQVCKKGRCVKKSRRKKR